MARKSSNSDRCIQALEGFAAKAVGDDRTGVADKGVDAVKEGHDDEI